VISLDYEHNTVPGTKAYDESKEPRDIAAQLKVEVVSGDGLYVTVLNWTPTGKEKAINYVDLSPAPSLNDARELVFLHSVALTRHGATDDLHFLTLSIDVTTKENAMDPKVLQDLISKSIADAVKPLTDRLTVLETTGAGAKTSIETLSADMASAKTTITTLSATLAQKDREELVLEAKRAGKVIPLSAEDLKTVDLGILRKIIAQTPATVPVLAVTPLSVADPAAGVSPTLAMVCRVTGQDPAKVLETNKAKA
jgi:phage I-like protein